MLVTLTRGMLRLMLPALTWGMGVYALLPILAPLLEATGYREVAQAIFVGYSLVCHQMPERSFFLFGYQMAYCQRDTAIYLTMFIAGLVYARYPSRFDPLSVRMYLLLIAPIAVDGFTQLFGLRESMWLLRVVTGLLFGGASVWLFYPRLAKALREIDVELDRRVLMRPMPRSTDHSEVTV